MILFSILILIIKDMLKSIFIIFFFQLIGEVLQKLFYLTIPGPVIGMILLICALFAFHKNIYISHSKEQLIQTSKIFTAYLPILFIPVGVGVIMHLSLIKTDLMPILLIIFCSTLLTIGVTALIMKWFIKDE